MHVIVLGLPTAQIPLPTGLPGYPGFPPARMMMHNRKSLFLYIALYNPLILLTRLVGVRFVFLLINAL